MVEQTDKQSIYLRWRGSQPAIARFLENQYKGIFNAEVVGSLLNFGADGSLTSDLPKYIELTPDDYESLREHRVVVKKKEITSIDDFGEPNYGEKPYWSTHAITLYLSTLLFLIVSHIRKYHAEKSNKKELHSLSKVSLAKDFLDLFTGLSLSVSILPSLPLELIVIAKEEGFQILSITETSVEEDSDKY